MRSLRVLAGALLVLLGATGAAAETTETVVIGVRVDGRPFAWQAEDKPDTYRGYLVDLCRDATTRAGYHYDPVPVTAAEREAVLAGKFEVKGKRLDLLCDPTTITLRRLDVLEDKAIFSPIIFVANGSFVRHKIYDNRKPCVIGARGEARPACRQGPAKDKDGKEIQTVVAPQGLVCAPAFGGADPPVEYFVAGYVIGTTAASTLDMALVRQEIRLAKGQTVCTDEAQDHRTGVKAFCGNALHFYFGDLDIIQTYGNLLREAGGKCDLDRAERPLSYEPYALLVPSTRADFRAKFVAAVYEIFNDKTAAGLFDAYFPDHDKSTALDMLFRINSIPSLRPAPAPPAGGR